MQIIADSGGTKTEWRLISSEGKIEQLITAGLNPNYTTEEEIFKVLTKEFNLNVQTGLREIHFYGAGCSSKQNVEKLSKSLAYFFKLDKKNIHINHDLLGAARAVAKNEPGIVCILGTGSNACFYDGEQITHQMISLGYILGDEGSGNYIGKQVLKDYLENNMPYDIKALFEASFPETNLNHMVENVYNGQNPAKYLASYYRFVIENNTNAYCQNLLINSFDLFLKKSVLKFDNPHQVPIHFVGGVAFSANTILRKLLNKHGLRAGLFIQSPIAGLTLYHQKNIK